MARRRAAATIGFSLTLLRYLTTSDLGNSMLDSALVIILLASGTGCALIGQSKQRSVGGFLCLGLLLGPVGLLIALRLKAAEPANAATGFRSWPPGWYADPRERADARWWDGGQWTDAEQQWPASGDTDAHATDARDTAAAR